MRANDPNLPHLRQIAEALGELREQVVFVGGAVAGLLVTDPLADSVRATRDVDAVVNTSRAGFHRMEEAVAARGFARDVSSEVICRWVHKASGVIFDLMPVQPEVLGFTNRWWLRRWVSCWQMLTLPTCCQVCWQNRSARAWSWNG